MKSRFPTVIEEAEELRKRLFEATTPLELTQRIKDLEAQVFAKNEANAKLCSEVEALYAAHLRDASLLEDALKEKEQ